MTDYFALLDEPRRPWLDAEALKRKFLARSAILHPDKIQSSDESEKRRAAEGFAELNAAHQCLAEPKSRLPHLLELERGAKPKDIQEIPSALADLFAEVAMVCGGAGAFLASRSKVTSPLLQVEWFERAQEWVDKLQAVRQKLEGLRGQCMEQLKTLDSRWMDAGVAARPAVLDGIEEIYRLFGYFNRWSRQVQERMVQLSLD